MTNAIPEHPPVHSHPAPHHPPRARSPFGGPLGLSAVILAVLAWLIKIGYATVLRLMPVIIDGPIDFATYALIGRTGVIATVLCGLAALVLGIVHLVRVRPRRPLVVAATAVAALVFLHTLVYGLFTMFAGAISGGPWAF